VSELRAVNDEQHRTVNEKLDRLLAATDRVAGDVSLHSQILARQETTLSDHVRRTRLLEVEVQRLDRFRARVMGVSAFVAAASAAVFAAAKFLV